MYPFLVVLQAQQETADSRVAAAAQQQQLRDDHEQQMVALKQQLSTAAGQLQGAKAALLHAGERIMGLEEQQKQLQATAEASRAVAAAMQQQLREVSARLEDVLKKLGSR
jgi:archaellum component FlaC